MRICCVCFLSLFKCHSFRWRFAFLFSFVKFWLNSKFDFGEPFSSSPMSLSLLYNFICCLHQLELFMGTCFASYLAFYVYAVDTLIKLSHYIANVKHLDSCCHCDCDCGCRFWWCCCYSNYDHWCRFACSHNHHHTKVHPFPSFIERYFTNSSESMWFQRAFIYTIHRVKENFGHHHRNLKKVFWTKKTKKRLMWT